MTFTSIWLFVLLFYNIQFTDGNSRGLKCDQYKRPLSGKTTDTQRHFMNCFGKDVESGESELIILIDSSGSMNSFGTYQNRRLSGFDIAKQFVKSLLSEVRVAFNATRIAIGTFSTASRINFNYILNPGYGNHKCKFNEDFKGIKFDGQLTNLRGTLTDAYNVFRQLDSNPVTHSRRDRSNKVVILLSDGYGNIYNGGVSNKYGKDASQEALRLKQTGYVEVYTIAVTPGSDQAMLKTIASDDSLFLYAKDFNDLGNLAWNIRGDPYEKDYETHLVDTNHCSNCDRDAICGCNLKTGNYRCVCNRGWYGTGEFSPTARTCFECKKGFYGDKRGYTKECKKCPADSTTNQRAGYPAKSIADCECGKGFTGKPSAGIPCTPTPCVPAPDINYAMIENTDTCKDSTFQTKCYYQCNKKYKLTSSRNYITCTDKGVWDTPLPKCSLITCIAPWIGQVTSERFSVQCSTLMNAVDNSFPSGARCIFTCKSQYYQSKGNNQISCSDSGKWNADHLQCGVATCSKIPKQDNKIRVQNAQYDCFDRTLSVGERCEFWCPSGYELHGLRRVLECQPGKEAVGSWNVDTGKTSNLPLCVDVEAPKFADSDRCDMGIFIKTETKPSHNYAEIDFEMINVTDNSNEEIDVTCVNEHGYCQYEMGRKYNIKYNSSEVITVNFNASDKSGNWRLCRFQVDIEDKEPPKIVSCPDNIRKKVSSQQEKVTWIEPTFEDNCGVYPECEIRIKPNIASGASFYLGIPVTIRYTAIDPSNNVNDRCTFTVSLEALTCNPINPPINGLVAKHGNLFQTKCRAGNYPAENTALYYICVNGNWMPAGPGVYPIPDCIRKDPPDGMDQFVVSQLQYEGNCNDPAVKESIQQKFKDYNLCADCDISEIVVFCGSGSLLHRRRKRNINQLSLKISIVSKVSKEKVRVNPVNVLNHLKTKMDTKVTPNFLKEVKTNKNWRLVNKYIRGLDTVNKLGTSMQVCADEGDEENTSESDLTKKCTVCGVGKYKDLKTNKCEYCPAGTYQPKSGQTSCITCPGGSMILGNDTKKFSSCKKVCKAGEFSLNGLHPCSLCPRGKYSDQLQSKSCKVCPVGSTTVVAGAQSLNECGSQCLPGTYSEKGVEPCLPCPKGEYQQSHGQGTCEACPYLKSTPGLGTVAKKACIEINDCASNPCFNNGHCIDLKDNYRCECKEGYWGKDCEKEVDECALQPCQNNGTCIDKFKGYICKCPVTANGENCNHAVTRCDSVTCSGHGKCVNLPDFEFKCVCSDFYTGEFCETPINPCYSNPCENNGYCIPNNKDFTCVCPKGYQGLTCEKKFNYCSSNLCKNGATCIDLKPEGFDCTCPAGYYGTTCDQLVNMCDHKKCHNGGECESVVNDVICKCAAGYSGPQCDVKQSNDFDYLFQSRISPSFSSIHGRKDLNEFTLTFWMRTSDEENIGTPISYAVEVNGMVDDNALVLNDYSNFNLVINNKTQQLRFGANDGFWHHVAVTWRSSTGAWKAYRDGILVSSSKEAFQRYQTIPKGGLFVLGEEQDEMGGGFTPGESYFGDLSQLHIWSRELSVHEIGDLIYSCGHDQGDVVAWADFATDGIGRIISTTPSVACTLNNKIRDFQVLRDQTLPTNLPNGQSSLYQAQTVYQCADKCISYLSWCRAFTYMQSNGKCRLYKSSGLIEKVDPVVSFGTDLYSYNCISALGMSTGEIKDSWITAKSTRGNAYSHLARLYNVPSNTDNPTYWQPQDNVPSSYIEINLQKDMRITAISTQGHYNKDVKEFATMYRIDYLNQYKTWKSIDTNFKGNNEPVTVVQNKLNIVGQIIRIFPRKDSRSKRIALRLELYGCPAGPQGVPDKNTLQTTYCNYNPCMNGGSCHSLRTKYKCTCLKGYYGNRCENVATCDISDLDIPLNGVIVSSYSNVVKYGCKKGYTGQEETIRCSYGQWEKKTLQVCRDVDECANQFICPGRCENTIGSYRCSCPIGTTKVGDQCYDVNECSKKYDGCQNTCANTDGGYDCTCPSGYYTRYQRNCYDINECTTGKHNCEQVCTNRLNGFVCSCKPGYRLASDRRTCIYIKCSRLNNIYLGTVSVKDDKATYTCNEGYKVDGVTERRCQPDGTWSGETPTCKNIKCENLYPPENGRFDHYSGNHFQAQVSVTCNSGFKLIGSRVRTCTKSSTWSLMAPRCAAETCPSFTVIQGHIVGLGRTQGSAVRIQCKNGYHLKQKHLEFRVCQSNGQWTGGNIVAITCDVMMCNSVPAVQSATIKYVGGKLYNGIARYQCSPGQCIEGDKVRRCQSNGEWSGKSPICKSNSCCRPPIPKHATLHSNVRFMEGDPAYIKCDKGFKTGGDDYRECARDGTWSGVDTTCTLVNCGEPGVLQNGIVYNKDKTTYESEIGYFCNPGYYVSGNLHRTCMANGKWSGSQPRCIKDVYGGHIRGKSGNVRCHGSLVCHFLFEVTQGKKVTISFSTFNIGENDKVEIYDGQSYTKFLSFTKDKRPKPITSNSHFIRVITNGFVSIDYKESVCGGLLNSEYGLITSPNYPNSYFPNLNCYWTIYRPYDRLELKFLDFYIQLMNVDFVTVTDGPFESSEILLYQYYRDVVPELTQEWTDKSYWIHFKTDSKFEKRGFKAFYKLYEEREIV